MDTLKLLSHILRGLQFRQNLNSSSLTGVKTNLGINQNFLEIFSLYLQFNHQNLCGLAMSKCIGCPSPLINSGY